MITDLLNTRAEQGELIELKDKRLIAKDMIIQTQDVKISVLSDTLSSVNGKLSETDKKLRRSRKIGLFSVLVSLLVGVFY